jgi:exopolysaccharide biosynthesis operon protein EpsL
MTRTYLSNHRFVIFAFAIGVPAIAMAADPPEKMVPNDTLSFAAGAGIRFEDNLFRLSDSVNTNSLPGKPDKSDWLYTANAGIKIDKPYAQQRFQFNAMATQNNFQNNSFLNYTGFDYRAAWLWSLTPNITGVLLANQEQTLTNFADFRTFNDRSIQTTQVRIFNIDGFIGGGWHLLGGLMQVNSRNSQNFTAVGDYVQNGGELGVKYVFPSESWLSLVQRESHGEYRGRVLDPVAQLDTGFDQSETEAKFNWRLTGKSTIDAKLGYLDRQHDHFSQRDYDGMVGKVEYQWATTDKLQINTSLGRNLFSFQEAGNSYYVADTLSIGPVWKVSDKTAIRLRYDYSKRDYRGAIVPVSNLRQDDVQSFVLGAEWRPRQTILVNATLQRDTRSSNFNNFDYDSNAVGINAQLLF